MCTNRPTPALPRGREQVARAVDHDPLELLARALPDRDEMDDRVDSRDRAAQALRHPSRRPRRARSPSAVSFAGLARIPDEAAHGQVAAAQLVDDVATHEAGAPGDEDQPAVSFWKFCQYLDGVGPRCPWYFEPIAPVPYGVSAASVSWTNEIWPIFISG